MRLGYRFHDAVEVEAADVVAPDDEDIGFLVGSCCESFSVLLCMTLSPAAPSGFWFNAVRTAPPLA
jgi:hypothetical protein